MMVIGIAVPVLHTGVLRHSGGQSSKVFHGGVVEGRAALLIRLEANLFMHIRQSE